MRYGGADDSWDEFEVLDWEVAMGRRQGDELIVEVFVRIRCCVPVIPVNFGNRRSDYETCSLGGRCLERLPNPATLSKVLCSLYMVRSRRGVRA